MRTELGTIEAIFRYPVKSMRGESLSDAMMGWHGIEGDRRFALRRVNFRGGFPWLTAGKFPDLLHYAPERLSGDGEAPTHVSTPEGEALPLLGEELARDVERRCGEPVQMMHLNHGMFDEAAISVIAAGTVDGVCRLAGKDGDVRRFRPNILVRTKKDVPFEEDAWVGARLVFGDEADAPTVGVTMRDVRCAMITFDPEQQTRSPDLMKAVVRANENNAGVYGAVIRAGRIAVGQTVALHVEAAATRVPEGVA
jgi:uncharacterized protein YcbX